MKTKEIDVWVIKNKNKPLKEENLICFFTEEEKDNWIEKCDELFKAKLIMELPEKKIEITESDIDQAIEATLSDYDIEHKDYIRFIRKLGL